MFRYEPSPPWVNTSIFHLLGQKHLRVSRRHVRGSRKRIPGSDAKDLDPRSVRIIDPTLTVYRQIHWDHRPGFAIGKGSIWIRDLSILILSESIGIRAPTNETHVYFMLFSKRLTAFFIEIYIPRPLSYDFVDILSRNNVVKA